MNPMALIGATVSLKKELAIVCAVLFFLLAMPIIALLSITNVGALASAFDTSGTSSPAAGPDPANISLYSGAYYPGDTYAFGNCTYWVFMRRSQVGLPIPTTWGNAATWAVRAVLDGYTVDHTPSQYAIMQIPNVDNGLGHAAFVESVDPDGTWHISEMNVVGFDEIDDKAMPARAASGYAFIHTQGVGGAN